MCAQLRLAAEVAKRVAGQLAAPLTAELGTVGG